MQLDPNIYLRLAGIDWLRNCGLGPMNFPFPVTWSEELNNALASMMSEAWGDVKTEAQGDLTGYLAKHHYDRYGGYWNRLARASRDKVKNEIIPQVDVVIASRGFPMDLSDIILLDLNRIALELTYRKQYSKVPAFFERLLVVYESGHLPCGWEGNLDNWPSGALIVF